MSLPRLESLCHQLLPPLPNSHSQPLKGGSTGFQPVMARARCPGYQNIMWVGRGAWGEGLQPQVPGPPPKYFRVSHYN